MCGRPWIRTLHTGRNWEDSKLKSFLQNKTAHTETISTTLFITRWQKKQTCNGTETNCVNDQTITSDVTNIHTRTYTHWVRLINELECSPNVSEHRNCIIFSSKLHTKSLAWYTHSLQYRFWYLEGDMNLLQARKVCKARTFHHASSRMSHTCQLTIFHGKSNHWTQCRILKHEADTTSSTAGLLHVVQQRTDWNETKHLSTKIISNETSTLPHTLHESASSFPRQLTTWHCSHLRLWRACCWAPGSD